MDCYGKQDTVLKLCLCRVKIAFFLLGSKKKIGKMSTKKKIELEALRKEFGINKKIPAKYEEPILLALSYYPELKQTHILFEPKKNYPVPYGTAPAPGSIFRKPAHRKYIISILEEHKPPTRWALMKHLPFAAKVGAFGHEMAHVVQYNSFSRWALLKFLLLYTRESFRRKVERAADASTIEHGLGKELYELATYLRRIPGYTQERKAINKNYLLPHEIVERIGTWS
jgi:hypothetical protein